MSKNRLILTNEDLRDIFNFRNYLNIPNKQYYCTIYGRTYNDEDGNKWLNAGDIAISLDMLPVNAAYFNCSENEELKRLLVHGLLHLNGMDHGDEHIVKLPTSRTILWYYELELHLIFQ